MTIVKPEDFSMFYSQRAFNAESANSLAAVNCLRKELSQYLIEPFKVKNILHFDEFICFFIELFCYI